MDIVASIDCGSDILAEGRAKAGEAESVGFLEREQCECTAQALGRQASTSLCAANRLSTVSYCNVEG
jgi:hypothetical protein